MIMVTVIMRDGRESCVLKLPDFVFVFVPMMLNHFANNVIMKQSKAEKCAFPVFPLQNSQKT